MQVQIELPDEVAARLGASAGEVSRRVLEKVMIDEYRAGNVGKRDFMAALGLETIYEFDGLLKAAGVMLEYAKEDLQVDRKNIREYMLRSGS
jgi:predicted HTH domain antitoxin